MASSQCHLCLQLWKKSNAWFYKEMPEYVVPEDGPTTARSASALNLNAEAGGSGAGDTASLGALGGDNSRFNSPRHSFIAYSQQQQQQQK